MVLPSQASLQEPIIQGNSSTETRHRGGTSHGQTIKGTNSWYQPSKVNPQERAIQGTFPGKFVFGNSP